MFLGKSQDSLIIPFERSSFPLLQFQGQGIILDSTDVVKWDDATPLSFMARLELGHIANSTSWAFASIAKEVGGQVVFSTWLTSGKRRSWAATTIFPILENSAKIINGKAESCAELCWSLWALGATLSKVTRMPGCFCHVSQEILFTAQCNELIDE